VLYSFAGGSDGAGPESDLTNINGVLYGTTYGGGANSDGTVFQITTAGTESVLYSFAGGNVGPGNLTNVNGVLYGTTNIGGGGCPNNPGCGTIFEVTTSGTETLLHTFGVGNDGTLPSSLINVNGVLYGTTAAGGTNGDGTVFKITTSGAESVLYNFAGGSDGLSPRGLTNVNGVLYGTTAGGGGVCSEFANGCGTVFTITTSGVERVLYSFAGGSDGLAPQSGLTNVNGVLYGTTIFGDDCRVYGGLGCGTVFKVTKSGVEKLLHRFEGGNDGRNPATGLTNVNGVLYGITETLGANGCSNQGCGADFAITTSGVKSVVHIFGGGSDGSYPRAALTNVNGVLYGTTAGGGTNGEGTFYSLTL
jgi:uncharacterized repeat protein (TIGR03803 family)